MAESRKRKYHIQRQIETKELIALVKERPCLWDRQLPEYRDRAEKEKAWVEIYKVAEPDYEYLSEEMQNLVGIQVTKKWYNVRDSYVKSKKHNVRNRPYIYKDLLSFLDSVYMDDGEYEETRPNESENIEEHWLNDGLVANDDTSQTNNPVEKTQDDSNIVTLLASLIQREEDDDRAFFKSLIPMVKSLSDEMKFEFRMQVMNLLKSLKNKEKRISVKIELENKVASDDDS